MTNKSELLVTEEQLQVAISDSKDTIINSVLDTLKPIVGTGEPSQSTVGYVGQFYINDRDGLVYMCYKITNNTYRWVILTNA